MATDHTQAQFITEDALAERLSVKVATLRRWRIDGRGPRFVKLNRCVRYDVSDLERWLSGLPAGGDRNDDRRAA